MRILAVDPGLRSGLAWWVGGDWGTTILDPMPTLDFAFEELDNAPVDLVVCESYTITAQTAKLSAQNWSLELIGALRWQCYTAGVEFHLQKPADAKNFVPDARLRQLDMWSPGTEDHARDATRHLILALAKSGQLKVPPLALA